MPITAQTVHDGRKKAVMRFTYTGTEALTATTIVDVSSLGSMRFGQAVDRVSIEEIHYEMRNIAANVLWDSTTDQLAIPLPHNEIGHIEYWRTGPLKNPEATGVTGDINLTTIPVSTTATGSLAIELILRKHT